MVTYYIGIINYNCVIALQRVNCLYSFNFELFYITIATTNVGKGLKFKNVML
jgi:hypothetical protein